MVFLFFLALSLDDFFFFRLDDSPTFSCSPTFSGWEADGADAAASPTGCHTVGEENDLGGESKRP